MGARSLTAACAALAISAGLVACGGDDEGDRAGDRPAPADASIGEPLAPETGSEEGGAVDVPELDEDGGAAVGDEAARCSSTTATPSSGNARDVVSAIVCLHNAERAARGLRPLRANSRLSRAAANHSRDMVARAFFSHDSPSGTTAFDRIRRAGYRARAAGENIGFGGGNLAQPAEVMRMWVNSRGHRANILNRRFREIGVGVAIGSPSGGGEGATYTVTFGSR